MAYQPLFSKNIIINEKNLGPFACQVPGDCDIIRILPTIDSIIHIHITTNPEYIPETGIKILRDKVEYFNVMNDNDKIFHIIIEKAATEWIWGSINITFMKDISFARMKGLLNSVKRAIESADMHGPYRC